MTVVDVELTIQPRGESHEVEARIRQSGDQGEMVVRNDLPITFNHQKLLENAADPITYGQHLTAMIFPKGSTLNDAWCSACGAANKPGDAIRMRLRLPDGDAQIHAIRWETLLDPRGLHVRRLALDEDTRLVRYLTSSDTRQIILGRRPRLRALLVVANPRDLAKYHLAPVDVQGTVAMIRQALGDIPLEVVGDERPATLLAFQDALDSKPAIVCLVCHGQHTDSGTVLWLENDQRNTSRVSGEDVSAMIGDRTQRPLLAVLIACESGGKSNAPHPLSALGPRLAQAGIGAVVAMQDILSVAAADRFLPTLFREIAHDGAVDRAVSVARAALREGQEWWIPAIWLRMRDGWLWVQESQDNNSSRPTSSREALLRASDSQIRQELAGLTRWGDLLQINYQERSDLVTPLSTTDLPRTEPVCYPRILQAYDDAAGALVLTGELGSGKTTALRILGSGLIERSQHLKGLPVPVILSLTSWSTASTLEAWMARELHRYFGVSRQEAKALVDGNAVLPLLDDLHELASSGARERCIAAINAYHARGLRPVVVVAQDDTLASNTRSPRLNLRKAVEVQPLAVSAVDQYLRDRGQRYRGLRAAVHQDPELRAFVLNPLQLSVAMLSSADQPAEHIIELHRHGTFWKEYIAALFQLQKHRRYDNEHTLRFLRWVADTMRRHNQGKFLVERLSPAWLETRADRFWYTLLDRLGGAVLVSLIGAVLLSFGALLLNLHILIPDLTAALLGFFLVAALFGGRTRSGERSAQSTLRIIRDGLLGALMFWGIGSIAGPQDGRTAAALGLVIALISGGPSILPRAIAPAEALQRSWTRTWVLAFVLGLAGIAVGVAGGLQVAGSPRAAMLLGLAVGTFLAFIAGWFGGRVPMTVDTTVMPNQGIRRSLRVAFRDGSAIALMSGVAAGGVFAPLLEHSKPLESGLSYGVVGGIIGWLVLGGYAVLSHYTLRLILVWRGALPLRVVDFLEYGVECGFLLRSGGAYIFKHRALLEQVLAPSAPPVATLVPKIQTSPLLMSVYRTHYGDLRCQTLASIQAIPEDKLTWAPNEHEPTCGDIIRQLIAYETTLIGCLTQDSAYTRIRANSSDASVLDLLETLKQSHRYALAFLSQVPDTALHDERVGPDGASRPIWLWLLSLLEHESEQRARLMLYLSLLGTPLSPKDGL